MQKMRSLTHLSFGKPKFDPTASASTGTTSSSTPCVPEKRQKRRRREPPPITFANRVALVQFFGGTEQEAIEQLRREDARALRKSAARAGMSVDAYTASLGPEARLALGLGVEAGAHRADGILYRDEVEQAEYTGLVSGSHVLDPRAKQRRGNGEGSPTSPRTDDRASERSVGDDGQGNIVHEAPSFGGPSTLPAVGSRTPTAVPAALDRAPPRPRGRPKALTISHGTPPTFAVHDPMPVGVPSPPPQPPPYHSSARNEFFSDTFAPPPSPRDFAARTSAGASAHGGEPARHMHRRAPGAPTLGTDDAVRNVHSRAPGAPTSSTDDPARNVRSRAPGAPTSGTDDPVRTVPSRTPGAPTSPAEYSTTPRAPAPLLATSAGHSASPASTRYAGSHSTHDERDASGMSAVSSIGESLPGDPAPVDDARGKAKQPSFLHAWRESLANFKRVREGKKAAARRAA